MTEPLSKEDFLGLIERYPLIFDVPEPGVFDGTVGLQPEFVNFVNSNVSTLSQSINHSADVLRGTGAVWAKAVTNGFEQIIELFLERVLNEEHLPIIVSSIYFSITTNEDIKRKLIEEIW